jgi:hypothetical protein
MTRAFSNLACFLFSSDLIHFSCVHLFFCFFCFFSVSPLSFCYSVSDKCEVGKPVDPPAISLTFQSWNRAELTISIPPVTVFPTLGVEIEFDITSMLFMGVNAKRGAVWAERVKKCNKCVAQEQGFCDKKWKSVLWKPADDNCQEINMESRVACEVAGSTGGVDDPDRPQWIVSNDYCEAMKFPLQTKSNM